VTQNLPPPTGVTTLANGASGGIKQTNHTGGGVVVSETRQEQYVDPQSARFFGNEFKIYNEVRLLLLVLLSGALGGSVHALRSLAWYVGNREFVRSWVLFYCMKPFVGSGLGVIFYFVVRGGFFAPSADFSNTSPFGFCALAALIGLFSESAVLKLKEIADTIFSRPRPGADARPQGSSNNPPPPPSGSGGGAPQPSPTRPLPGAPNPPPPGLKKATPSATTPASAAPPSLPN
jgi:hypothetical protein